MATERQTTANRRNAGHSTGPKTAAGKAASSANATTHGLHARRAVIHGEEEQDEFDELHAGLQIRDLPADLSEQYLVDEAAIAQWKMVRAEVFENNCYTADSTPL